MLSDSEDEKPFILEEPAITSTFSAAIKQRGQESGRAKSPMSQRAAPKARLLSFQTPARHTLSKGAASLPGTIAKILAHTQLSRPLQSLKTPAQRVH